MEKISGVRQSWANACWPLEALHSVNGKNKKLSFSLNLSQHHCQHTVAFKTLQERELWQHELSSRIDRGTVEVDPSWTPERQAPILLQRRSNVPCQVLGNLEVTKDSFLTAQASLRLMAATLGSDIVVDVAFERMPQTDRTRWRASGTATKCLDSDGSADLAMRLFGDRVEKFALWAAVLAGVTLLLRFFGSPFAQNLIVPGSAPVAESTAIGVLLAIHLWPIVVSLWLWCSRIPQLAKATSIALVGFAIPPIAACLVLFVFPLVGTARVQAGLASAAIPMHRNAILIIGLAIYLSWKISRTANRLYEAVRFKPMSLSNARKWIGICCYAVSCLYLVVLLGWGVVHIYAIVRH